MAEGPSELVLEELERGYQVVSVVDEDGHRFDLRLDGRTETSTSSLTEMAAILREHGLTR